MRRARRSACRSSSRGSRSGLCPHSRRCRPGAERHRSLPWGVANATQICLRNVRASTPPGGRKPRVSRRCTIRSLRPARVLARWLKRERSLAAPEDALDALADGRQMWTSPALVFTSRSEDRRVHVTDGLCECSSGIALVADQGLPAQAAGSQQELERHIALVAFGRSHRNRPGRPVGREDRVQPKAPEEPAVTRAIPAINGVAERRALDRLTAAGRGRRPSRPLRSAMLMSTVDFDPAAYKPSKTTASAAESIV
jgi:hypothetical protein